MRNTTPPFILPGEPGNEVTAFPEGYDSTISGPSGNMTVNGTSTFMQPAQSSEAMSKRHPSLHPRTRSLRPMPITLAELVRRGLGAANESLGNLINDPPYAIHNAFGALGVKTIATNATHSHSTGFAELDTHNLFGMMEAKGTFEALLQNQPGTRPFIIGRSTFPSSGKWGGHWVGC